LSKIVELLPFPLGRKITKFTISSPPMSTKIDIAATEKKDCEARATWFGGTFTLFPMPPSFQQYIGIDYSGAEVPTASLSGLRIYQANGSVPPREVPPPPSPRRYWTRQGIAEWLVYTLAGAPAIVGIDHAFSFPLRYFQEHGLPLDWPSFMVDFQQHWPTDDALTYVDFVRDGIRGNGAARYGNPRWRRLTELRARTAKSVFHFDVPGSVAKSTHAGIPWLLYLRRHLGDRVHFWPFDGWKIAPGSSVIAEVYPALWCRNFPVDTRTADQQDAFSTAAWLQQADQSGALPSFLHPPLSPAELATAAVEGWILGVGLMLQ
jgi:hypothetical protein